MLRDNYRKAKAELSGKAVSRARMIKCAVDISDLAGQIGVTQGPCVAEPAMIGKTPAIVRMLDDEPMVFYKDGSIRHVLTKEARKLAHRKAKKARRHAAKAR